MKTTWLPPFDSKEILIKFPLSTVRSDKVAPDELATQAEDTGDDDRL